MCNIEKINLSKNIQKKMVKFFFTTSVPRMMSRLNNK